MTLYYSFVFTLEGKKTNEYLYCLMLLWKTLNQGTLRGDDQYVVMTDPQTLEKIKPLAALKGIRWLVRQPPKTVYEGMLWKYQFPTLANIPDGTTLCYLDVDMLALRPVRIQLPEDSLAVFPEGKPDDSNYCGNTTLHSSYGFTAGFFAYRLGPNVRRVFSTILEEMGKGDKGFYTLDQPFFNHAISATANSSTICLPADFISFNGNNNPGATLLNFCGEPGDDAFHYVKMINWYLASGR